MTVVRLGGYFLHGENGWGPRAGARVFEKRELAQFMKQFKTYYPNAVVEEETKHGEVQTEAHPC